MKSSIFENIHYIISAAWRRRYLIVLPIVIFPFVGLLMGTFTPKMYQTHISFLVQETAKMNPFLEDFAVSTNVKERMGALKVLLHSRHVLSLVAKDLDLFDKNTSNPQKDRIINRLSRSLSVELAGSDVVKLHYKDSQPKDMAKTINAVSLRFIENLLAPEKSSIKASETFLSKQLELRNSDLLKSEKRLAIYKSKHAAELPELHSKNVNLLQVNKQLLSEKRIEIAGAKAKFLAMKQTLGRTDPIIGKIEEKIVSLKSELTLLRSRYTDKHSKIQASLRNLDHLEKERIKVIKINSNIGAIEINTLWNMANSVLTIDSDKQLHPLLVSQMQELQNIKNTLSQMQEEIFILEKNISILETKVGSYGKHELKLSEFERDLLVKRKLYEDLLERHEMARVTGALGRFEFSERIKMIDHPFVPTQSINHPMIVYILAGLLGGIFLGSGLAIISEQTDTTVRRADVLEKLSGLPVLSRIPNLSTNLSNLNDLTNSTIVEA